MTEDCDENSRPSSTRTVQFNKILEVCYQNIRGLRTKQIEVLCNVYSMDFYVFCLTETWLNDRSLFPGNFYIFRSDKS